MKNAEIYTVNNNFGAKCCSRFRRAAALYLLPFCAILFALFSFSCSDLFQKAFELPADPQGLTVFNLPSQGNFTVYVYPDTVDISSYTALTGTMNAESHLAIGPHPQGETFALWAVNGLSMNAEWDGSGLLPVILFNAEGDDSDKTNPRYRTAVIRFTGGVGKVYFTGFAPITGEGRGLTVRGLPADVDYEAYVFNGGTNIFTYNGADRWFKAETYQARGRTATGHTFPLYIWNGSAEFGQWSGSGSLPVLLVNPSGDALDEDDPVYRRAMINFTHGVGVVDFDKFAPVVDSIPEPDPDQGLTITGFDHTSYQVFVFIDGVNLTGYTAVESALNNNRYTAVGEFDDESGMFQLFNSVFPGVFVGNGNYQVILKDITNPEFAPESYRWALVSMVKGIGTISFNDFTTLEKPAVDPFYYIAYNKNNDDANGFMAPVRVNFGAPRQLDGNNFSLIRHGFLGWSLAADGEVVYANRDEVVDICDTVGGTVTLYAQWEPLQYYVRYYPNEPNPANEEGAVVQGTMADSIHRYNAPQELSPLGFTRVGYEFIGWNTQLNGSGVWYADTEEVLNLFIVTGDTFDLYAQWRPITYTVRYDYNGKIAAAPPAGVIHTYDVSARLSIGRLGATTVTRWTTQPGGGGAVYTDRQWVKNMTIVPNDVITLYAQETEEIKFTVRFNVIGADGEYTHYTETGITPGDTVAGPTTIPYKGNVWESKFVGWYYPEGDEWTAADPVMDDITLTAQWTYFETGDTGPGGGLIYYALYEGFFMACGKDGAQTLFEQDENGEDVLYYYLECTPLIPNRVTILSLQGDYEDCIWPQLLKADGTLFAPSGVSYNLGTQLGFWSALTGTGGAFITEGLDLFKLENSEATVYDNIQDALVQPRVGNYVSGKYNTRLILDEFPASPAAKACADYRGGGRDDWFLPERGELVPLQSYVVVPRAFSVMTSGFSNWYYTYYLNQGVQIDRWDTQGAGSDVGAWSMVIFPIRAF